MHQALVMVVNGDSERLFRMLLANDVVFQVGDDLTGCGDVGE